MTTGSLCRVLATRRRSTARSITWVSSTSRARTVDALRLGRVEGRLQAAQLDLGDGQDDRVLGRELVVHGRLRDAEGVGDHLQRRAADAVVGEQLERGGDRAASARRCTATAVCSRRDASPTLAVASRSASLGGEPTRPGGPMSDDRRTSSTSSWRSASRAPTCEEDVVADDFVLMLGVDLVNFPKFPRVDDGVTYPEDQLDIRQQLDVDSGAELADYSRALPPRPALHRLLEGGAGRRSSSPGARPYLLLCVDGWAAEVARRYGAETMAEIEWAAWNDQVVPELERMRGEFLPAGTAYDDPNQQVAEADRADHPGRSTPASSRPAPDAADLTKPRAGHVVPRQPTSTCCSASRRGPRRSPSATGSTRCSTSSGRCGATRCCPGPSS